MGWWEEVKKVGGAVGGFVVGGPVGAAAGYSLAGGGSGGKVGQTISGIADSLTGSKAQHAAERSADATLQAAREAEALNRERYGEAEERLSPYLQGAERSYGRLQNIMGVGEPQSYSIGTEGARGALLHRGTGRYGDPGGGYGDVGDVPGSEMGDPYEGLREGTFRGGSYGNYMGDFMPELPEENYQDTAAYQQSQEAIRSVGEERQMAAAEAMGATGGFYGGRRAESAAEIGGDQAIDLANLEQGSMQNYYARLAQSQQMRQAGAGALASLEQQDIGRQATMEQGDISRREDRYYDQKGQNRQAFTNYMNTLQNLASPQVAQNLSALGVNQGLTMGAHNIIAQESAGGQRVAGQQARDQATGNLFGAGLQVAGVFI